jgi:hypothetical protein
MSDETLLYRLLARAFLDIRIASLEGRNGTVFELADLFHNVPFQIARIRLDDGDFHEILDWLEMRCEQKGIKGWLLNAIDECSK